MRALVELVRPFTLLPPMLGMVTGALAALGVVSGASLAGALPTIILGAVMAATLNAASNVINQIFDVELDRTNKPDRPLPSGRVTPGAAWVVCVVLYVAANAMAWFIDVGAGRECFGIVLFTTFLTYAYSGVPFRWRRFGWRANLTVALPRGLLLKVAGWSCVAPVFSNIEPWYLGATFGLFLFGATSTKDFADVAGDAAGGVRNLPVRLGAEGAVRVTGPFFWLPWLLFPLGVVLPGDVLTPSPIPLCVLGVGLAAYGWWIRGLLVKDPEALGRGGNHPAWRHMYLLMMVAQVGSAAVYQIGAA